jgi:hypothetical protein
MAFGDKRPRTYVKTGDLKNGDKIVFISAGSWENVDFSKTQDGSDMKSVYKVRVSVNGQEPKEMTINSTSGNSLAEKWGDEGDTWKGKEANVQFVKMMCFGEMKDVLCLKPNDNDWKDK